VLKRSVCDPAAFDLSGVYAESVAYPGAAAGTAHPSREFLRLRIIWTTH